jgi:gliding motility-associated lipoprotein GldD
MHMNRSVFLLLVLACSIASSCNSPFTPKERGYFRIDFPERSYQTFEDPAFPYSFEYPAYGKITRDSSFLDENPDNPYWINIDFPRFNGRIYLSYKSIGGVSVYKVKTPDGYRDSLVRNTFDGLREEAYRMTYKHTLKASGIADSAFQTVAGVNGVYFKVEGDAATARQFYVTDSVRHFLRGALYFDTAPNSDSLSIVNDFLEVDMRHLVETIRWKQGSTMR